MSLMLCAAKHGSDLYLAAVQLRREVLRWPLGLDFTEEDLAGEAEDACLVALDGSSLAATLSLVRHLPEMKMRQVAVRPERQGQGIGKALVAYSEEFARAEGATKMVLHARETAVPFYRSMDYLVVGDLFEEVGIPHFRMEKAL